MLPALAVAEKNINVAAAKKIKSVINEGGDTMIYSEEIKSELNKLSKQIIEMGNSL